MTGLLSVIIPAWNEAEQIEAVLQSLQTLRQQGHELILVDGGSDDDTRRIAAPWVDRLLQVPRGRARQLAAGAAQARGDWLWFLHADTLVSAEVLAALLHILHTGSGAWGRFDVRLSGQRWPLRIIERLINLRSRLSGIATGDQALFMHRDLYRRVGGWPQIPLMEDVALSRALKRIARPLCLYEQVLTSSRRWERQGVLATVLLMWYLRLAFTLGADPQVLAARYAGRSPDIS
jgi:rSAM/selenodomain-associated transferase 2